MVQGWEWVIIAISMLLFVPVVAIVIFVVSSMKKRPAQIPPASPQLALPAQLDQADQMLAGGQIDPAEHAAMRNRILGITD